ncbi:ATP-dependent RNA helicase A-like [Melia azedarach]|uniref:ATP-dependent RNA helicase A-like n=1 Tax=Melia azedarach TaxID=155640 RepID=A0ACC1YF89_MELAZ|nr:ATP-dependent RNA helicase A-like [Melia azedarach]
MDIAVIADTVSAATSQTLGFAKFILRRHYLFSAAILPKDALAPPPVKSSSRRTAPRTLLRKKRRTKRKSYSGDDFEDSSEGDGFFGGGNDDGPFGGGRHGGGGWNFDGFGGQNWDESSRWFSNDFAFDFVYEVIYWIALSNCVHFAFKKVARIMADADRDKGPMRLTSVC